MTETTTPGSGRFAAMTGQEPQTQPRPRSGPKYPVLIKQMGRYGTQFQYRKSGEVRKRLHGHNGFIWEELDTETDAMAIVGSLGTIADEMENEGRVLVAWHTFTAEGFYGHWPEEETAEFVRDHQGPTVIVLIYRHIPDIVEDEGEGENLTPTKWGVKCLLIGLDECRFANRMLEGTGVTLSEDFY